MLGPLFGGKPAINDIAPNAQLRIRSLKVCGMLEKKRLQRRKFVKRLRKGKN